MLRDLIQKHKAAVILLGDIAVFFGSLAATLFIRYGSAGFDHAYRVHFRPFSILLVIFIGVFYIADLYTYTSWRSTLQNGKRFAIAMLANFFISIGIFYAFGETFKLTPKVGLIIFTLLFSLFDIAWRYLLARILAAKKHTQPLFLLASSEHAAIAAVHVDSNPELGYALRKVDTAETLMQAVESANSHCLVVIDSGFMKDARLTETVRTLLAKHVEIETLSDFSERILGRVPLSEIDETWLIEEMKRDKSLYETAKRGLDAALAIVGMAVLSPVYLTLFILIPTTTKGPAIYRQERVGRNEKTFTIYKFRNMYHDLARNPDMRGTAASWWQKDDPRVTPLGQVLRRTHLDELPQLWNILRGDMSFVGPRPERPQFTEELTAKLPAYTLRTVVRPGLAGWAQLRFQYAGTVEEWAEKLEYDLYYVKHRGFLFDLGILARTAQKFL